VIWVSGEAAPSIHRLGFFDPDKDPMIKNWIQY
jgi:hypothetical protein